MQELTHRIGKTSVIKVAELELNDFTATQLFPSLNMTSLSKHPEWMDERIYDSTTEKVFLSVHTWVVRHNGKIILIDTGAGNRKDRHSLKVLHHLHQPFLSRLAAVGVNVEEVDYILLTHIHADHVGWNTSLHGKAWLPTFPNATVICSDLEWRYAVALAEGDDRLTQVLRREAGVGDPVRIPVAGVLDDSIEPIRKAGKLQRITIDGSEVLEGVRFLSTPGHSIDHASISITSAGEEAIFGGDVLHHPFELPYPNLISMFCEFPEAARESRKRLVTRAANGGAAYFSSHFPASSVGKIVCADGENHWEFLEDVGRLAGEPPV